MRRFWNRLYFVLTVAFLSLLTTCTENPIILTLNSPEIRITYIGSAISADSETPLDLGDVEMGLDETYIFKITNTSKTSNLDLTGNPTAVLGGDFTDLFTIEGFPPEVLGPGESGILSIRFSPTEASGRGNKSASITIESNDEDEEVFTFSIEVFAGEYVVGIEVDITDNIGTSLDNMILPAGSFSTTLYAVVGSAFNVFNTTYTWYVNSVQEYSDWHPYNTYYFYETGGGTYTVKVVATDGTNRAEDSMSITIVAPPDPPELSVDREPDDEPNIYNEFYNNPVTITITPNDAAHSVFYTVDGTTPTEESTEYTDPFSLEPTDGSEYVSVKAIEVDAEDVSSNAVSSSYRFRTATPVPDISEEETYYNPTPITFTSTTEGAVIRYELDTGPDEDSEIMPSPWTLGETTTFRVAAFKTGWPAPTSISPPNMAMFTYEFEPGMPIADPPPGVYYEEQAITLSTLTDDGVIYYTLDGESPDPDVNENAIVWDDTPIEINQALTLRAVTKSTAMGADSDFLDDDYDLTVPAPVISPLGGTHTTAVEIELTLSTPMDGVEIHYNTNTASYPPRYSDTMPWEGSVYYTDGIYDPLDKPVLTEDTGFNARAFRMGWLQSAAVREVYEITTTVVDIDLIQRLALGNYLTTINFDGAEIYLIFTIAEAGDYYIRWSDSGEGDGTDTVDIEVRLYNADPITGQPVTSTNLVGSQMGFDGYYSPYTVSLTPGDYYLYLAFQYGSVTTGTAKILVTD